jgi:hypothetical protein
MGNNSIYMTTDRQSYLITNQEGNAVGSSAYQTASNNSNGIKNAIQLNLSDKPYNASDYFYTNNNNKEFEAEFYFSAVGGSPFWENPPWIFETIQQKIGMKASIGGSEPSDVFTDILTAHNTGLNITKTSSHEGSSGFLKGMLAAVNITLIAAGLAFPEIGIPVAATSIMDQFAGISGTVTTSNINGFTGTGSSWEWEQIDNGSLVITSGSGPAGHNVYGTGTMVLIQINDFPAVASSVGNSLITLFAQNEMCDYNTNYPSLSVYSNGSTTSANVNMVQAVSIGGYAYYAPGVPDSNNVVTLQQNVGGLLVNFALKTDANGYWHFFAEPGTTYSISASCSDVFGQIASKTYNIPSSLTSTSETGQNLSNTNGIPVIYIGAGVLNGEIKSSSTGGPLSGATVTASYNGNSISTTTNGNGNYNYRFILPISADYSMSASHYDYYTGTGSVSVTLNKTSWWNKTLTYHATPPPGCVLYGTNITLSDGSTIEVQDLAIGEHILSYNFSSQSLINGTVVGITASNVTQIWKVDGIVGISGINDQPLYVQLQNGAEELLPLGKLNDTMKIFDPLNGTWIQVYNITVLNGNFTVYDISAAPPSVSHNGTNVGGDYIANGILIPDKLA